jgi:hypothetical protein
VLFSGIYHHLRYLEANLEVRVWPALDKVQLQHITTLGVCPELLPPPSTVPQPLPGLKLAPAFQDEFFDLPPEELTYEKVKAQTARLNLTARAVVFLYIRADIDRATRLLALWEERPIVAAHLLGTDRIKMVVWDLRELLQSVGRLRTTPPDWVDPFNYGQFMEAKRRRMEKFLQEQLRVAAASVRDTTERQARLLQGLAALPEPSPDTVRASFVPALMSLGPLGPMPPGESYKARSRSQRKRRAREFKRLEELGLHEPKRPRESWVLPELTEVGAAGDRQGSSLRPGSDRPPVGPSPPHTDVAPAPLPEATVQPAATQPPVEPQETRTVNIVEPEPEPQPSTSAAAYGQPEPQPSTSAAAYGVFARLGPRPPVVQLEIDSSDEDLGKYSPASEEPEDEEEIPPPVVPRPILKPPSRTVVIRPEDNAPPRERRVSYALETRDDTGRVSPLRLAPPPGRKKLKSHRLQRLDQMPQWERRHYDDRGQYQPPRGYTPPGSYTPPEITGLTPPTESPEEWFTLDPDVPDTREPVHRPRPDDFDEEVEVVHDEEGRRIPVLERLGPRLSKSQKRKRRKR